MYKVEGMGWFIVNTRTKRQAYSEGVEEFGRGGVDSVTKATEEEIADYKSLKGNDAVRPFNDAYEIGGRTMSEVKEYTAGQYMLDVELENYISQALKPRFESTAKLARQFLKIQGKNPNDLLQFVTAVKALEQLYDDEHI